MFGKCGPPCLRQCPARFWHWRRLPHKQCAGDPCTWRLGLMQGAFLRVISTLHRVRLLGRAAKDVPEAQEQGLPEIPGNLCGFPTGQPPAGADQTFLFSLFNPLRIRSVYVPSHPFTRFLPRGDQAQDAQTGYCSPDGQAYRHFSSGLGELCRDGWWR